MTRFMLVACTLLPFSAWAQQRAKPPPGECPSRPAECQINVQVFDFGRGQMSPSAPAINGHNTISVTCTRAPKTEGLDVDVTYELKALPAEPNRSMRDSHLGYLRYFMYVDPARTRYWGDGISYGTATFQGGLFLDDRNRVGTIVHQVYGKVDAGQTALAGQWLGLVAARLEYRLSCR
jgi:spore coat protein U-like protein